MIKNILNGITNGLINSKEEALEPYKPKILVNDAFGCKKVLTSICAELNRCEEFKFSVAFLTEGGVTVLLNTLKELEDKKIKGTIIVSQYQNFTQPKALKKLLNFKNIDLRIVTEEQCKMHAKGYIFKKGDEYSFIVGSSNLTQEALCLNKEWNLLLCGEKEGKLVQDILQEFKNLYNLSTEITTEWIEEYSKIYNLKLNVSKNANNSLVIPSDFVKPNKMQVNALSRLEQLRSLGEKKALIVSATGTGKTYLAAFDVKKYNPKKFLFIVHREQIAKTALASFQKVIGSTKKMALLGGGKKDVDNADYVFAMITTLTKDDVLHSFKKDEFDYIVIDEVHRAGAASYQKVFKYFTPKFLLGMSATPERTDGFNIYEMFDFNIAYEIRLQDAIQEELICPFHYFGVSEISVNGKALDDASDFRYLTCDERVNNIIKQIEFYGYCGNRVKGLIFCSRKEEARELSKKFNALGYKTESLDGSDSQEKREKTIQRLEQDVYNEDALDYIFTVDIFNEGVDIPAVNQIVMLRPTESSIIFIQQLGRGLRKFADKDYVVVIDFIGNYDNNYLIPIALSGDKSLNKDALRQYVFKGTEIIPGCCTVYLDPVAKERIYSKIDTAQLGGIKILKDAYIDLRNKLGKVPSIMDFEKYGSIDVLKILRHPKYYSYYNFLKSIKEDDYKIQLNNQELLFIEYISRVWACGKRPHELEFLKILLSNSDDILNDFRRIMKNKYPDIKFNDNSIKCVLSQFEQKYYGASYKKYESSIFIEKISGKYVTSTIFKKCLENSDFKNMVLELIDFALERNKSKYGNRYLNTSFQLYQKYTYEDVCRCLDWKQNEIPQNIGGYKYDSTTNTFPIFINYNKDDNISNSIKYEDKFLNNSLFRAISKNGRTKDSKDVKTILNSKGNNTQIELFVRKNKDDKESKEFYYLGKIYPTGEANEFVMGDKKDGKKAVEIFYSLKTPLEESLYQYITG